MNLDTILSAANWLYTHSPAKHLSSRKNAILVYGDDPLADALFDMLFSIACKPGIHIHLVRVVSDAEEKEEKFLERNLEGIQYFSQNILSASDAQRPMTISFYDASSPWKDAYSFAYAYVPAGILDKDVYQFNRIPLLCSQENRWRAVDEAVVPVLKAARKVHTAYTAGWNSSYRERDIDRDLYGNAGERGRDDYLLRSSLRFAASIPWKMEIANAYTSVEMSEKIHQGRQADGGPTIRDFLSWQEHRSWQAFMTLEGWRMPTADEMESYLFQAGHDHREKQQKLHPCLCDLEDDWFAPHPKRLKEIRHSAWSDAYQSFRQDFSKMDRISLEIHHKCKEIVLSDAYGQKMNAHFSMLEDALVSIYTPHVDILFRRLRFVENMFFRLRQNEANSYLPFQSACDLFLAAVREYLGAAPALEDCFQRMLMDAQAAVSRNQYCDYQAIDEHIIDWLPWMMDESATQTVWKLYSYEDPIANIISCLMLRPRELVFLYDRQMISSKQMDIYREILAQHGLDEIKIRSLSLAELDQGRLPLAQDEISLHVVDVTQAGDFQHRIMLPVGVRAVYYEGNALHDKAGFSFCAPLYPQNISMTVDEILKMRGQKVKSTQSNNEMLGMEEDFEKLWEVSHLLKAGGNLKPTIEMLSGAEQKLRSAVFPCRGTEGSPIVCSFPAESYKRLFYHGGIRTLFDLQELGAISGLTIGNDEQCVQISMNIFPDPSADAQGKYRESEKSIRHMVSCAAQDGIYAVDDAYISAVGPVQILDLSRPIRMDAFSPREKTGISALLKEGLMRRSEECANEYQYKSSAVRHGLKKEGFPLETYVYYTLFLSGAFDDVKSNVTVVTGQAASGADLEKEMDVLVTAHGKMGIISCKDTPHIKIEHIIELIQQIRDYGVGARAILVCAEDDRLDEQIIKACDMLQVTIIGMKALRTSPGSKRKLVSDVLRAVLQ